MDKRRKATGIGTELSRLKIKKPDKELLGIVAMHPIYKPYAIINKIFTDWRTRHKNEEISRELLDHLLDLDLGNATTFKAKTDKEVEDAIDMVFDRDHIWSMELLSGQLKIEDLGTITVPEIFISKAPDVLDYNTFAKKRQAEIDKAKTMSNPPLTIKIKSALNLSFA